jgi:hypothetical protein
VFAREHTQPKHLGQENADRTWAAPSAVVAADQARRQSDFTRVDGRWPRKQWKQRIAKLQIEGLRKRVDEAPPPGIRPDGTVEILAPGQPKPLPTIVKEFPANEEDDI